MEKRLSDEISRTAVIAAKGLHVISPSGSEILKGVDLDVVSNSINTIIGPSGSGKSTLLKVMNRLAELEGLKVQGEVTFMGKDIMMMNPYELRRKVGMVFQVPNPFPMSIYDNVAFGPRLHWKLSKGELDEIVVWALSEVGLYEEVRGNLSKSALTLSGGQKQRLCMARALAVKPSVLLMDEPTSSLDPVSKDVVERLMLKLKRELTLVLVTHDMTQAKRVSDYVSVISNGRIERWGRAEEII
ncbi:MAG: phosphate ABC transporter ATP-binding protein [Thermoprotei archaeon]|jgi:phosphate transport system ATP-binding protein